MDVKKIKYTISWTQRPQDWNIPNMISMLEVARKQALILEQKKIEDFSLKETKNLLDRIRSKK